MQRSTIIVAGGSGRRMGGTMPKQFLLLKGRPLLMRTLDAFHGFDADMPLVLVLPEDHHGTWQALCVEYGFRVPHRLIAGGVERYHSTQLGLAAVDHDGLVAVHDGVRPLVSTALIGRCFDAAQVHSAVVPVVPIMPSVREVASLSPFGEVSGSRALDRSRLRAVQTPQCFHAELLRRAFDLPYEPGFTDEATMVERLGVDIHMVEGEENNIKVTTPFDLRVAELVLV
jgi:2-C-methyl-D-erythritol 4-phosphate cytidylyltransferase